MKDTRQLLKEAREAIKNKNYELSLQLSKSVLKQDKSNYMALVFYGVSLQEIGPSDEAPRVFKKAIDGNPTNPLAWNGLINYYEKFNADENKQHLTECYLTILPLETNDKKVLEYSEKLSKTIDSNKILSAVKILDDCKNKFENLQLNISEIIVKISEKHFEKLAEIQPIFEECLLKIINDVHLHYYSLYISLLYSQKRYEDLLKCAEKMHEKFPNDATPLNWICKVYNQLYVERHDLTQIYYKANDYYKEILTNDPNNAIALFTKSISLYDSKNLIECRDVLIEVTKSRPGLIHAWIFLTQVNAVLNLPEDAHVACKRAKNLLKSFISNENLNEILKAVTIQYLSQSRVKEDWKNASELYSEISKENLRNQCKKFVITAHINLEEFDVAENMIAELEKNEDTTLLKARLLCKKNSFRQALNLLETSLGLGDAPEKWMEIGILRYNIGEYHACLVPLIKAARFDQNNHVIYLYLGRFYTRTEQFQKAQRCYEKAFKINPKSREIAMELNEIYRKNKNWEASQNILKTFVEDSQAKSWTWLNLGLNYLDQGDYIQAIDNLQKAIRVERENPKHCWEALADAYLARGSYNSALKCYAICAELSDNKLYSCLQIANIKKILGEYTEARADFEQLLMKNEHYVPVLKGLAETCLLQAKECHTMQRLGRARDHTQSAVDNLLLAVKQKSSFTCLWKLLGDAFTFTSKLPKKYSFLIICDIFNEVNNEEQHRIEQKDLYEAAVKSYSKAITISNGNIAIWYDLGCCYLNQALTVTKHEEKTFLLTYILSIANHCIEHEPGNWQYWNLLGNVAMQQDPPNFALAQHAFIKAVTLESHNVVSWSNLGTLYLILGDIKLANKAFAQGQRSDPNYPNSWIGQAMIAETISKDDAMDLLRHSTWLGQHQQGALGYGYWVCKTLKENPEGSDEVDYVKKMNSIPVACDALTWYAENEPSDACAWTLLGFLRERMGLRMQTLEAYQNAYKFSDVEHKDLTKVNLGRIFTKLGRYDEAVNIFQEVTEATFESGTGLALALYKDCQYEGAYSAYEQVLHWLTEQQNHQSDLLVALASIAYMFQGLDPAKTLLFQSIQLKPTSPWSLYATLSLALIHRDVKLADLILNEMEAIKDDVNCLDNYSAMLSYFYLTKNKSNKAVYEVSKVVHKHPNSAPVWGALCKSLLATKKPSSATVKCAQAVMALKQTDMDVTKILSLASLALAINKNHNSAKILAEKAVHAYPNVADGWAVLGYTLAKDKSSNCGNVSKIFGILVNDLDTNVELQKWMKTQINV